MFSISKDQIDFEMVKEFCQTENNGIKIGKNAACVEYIEGTNTIPRIVSAFANSQGGILVIAKSKSDDNKIRQISGIRTAGYNDIMDIADKKAYQERLFPYPEAELVKLPINDNIICFVIRVQQSLDAPHLIDDKKCFVWKNKPSLPYPYVETSTDPLLFQQHRRRTSNQLLQQIKSKMENRHIKVSGNEQDNKPHFHLIAHPVFLSEPLITPEAIYETFDKNWSDMKRVVGGIARLSLKDKWHNLEINEYGLVSYRKTIPVTDEQHISVFDFINGIDTLLDPVKTLYKSCQAFVRIKFSVQLENVWGLPLSKKFDESYRHRNFSRDPICYENSVRVSTTTTYLPPDLYNADKVKSIYEELVFGLLWAFDIDTTSKVIRNLIRNLIKAKF